MIKSKYTCKCGSNSFRAEVYQNVDVELDDKGEVLDNGFSFSEPQLQRDKVYCDKCGENVK